MHRMGTPISPKQASKVPSTIFSVLAFEDMNDCSRIRGNNGQLFNRCNRCNYDFSSPKRITPTLSALPREAGPDRRQKAARYCLFPSGSQSARASRSASSLRQRMSLVHSVCTAAKTTVLLKPLARCCLHRSRVGLHDVFFHLRPRNHKSYS